MNKKHESSFWKSMTNKASEARENFGQKVRNVRDSIRDNSLEASKNKASEMEEFISNKASDVSKYFRKTAKESTLKKQPNNSEVWPETENYLEQEEIYHIFVSYQVASQGGTQKVTLKIIFLGLNNN